MPTEGTTSWPTVEDLVAKARQGARIIYLVERLDLGEPILDEISAVLERTGRQPCERVVRTRGRAGFIGPTGLIRILSIRSILRGHTADLVLVDHPGKVPINTALDISILKECGAQIIDRGSTW